MIFYVYEHWRPDTSLCFYVGKGSGRRAWYLSRSGHHRHICNVLAAAGLRPEVRIVANGLTEEAAFAVESARIKQHRDIGVILANVTDGGGGISNPAPEVRLKMSGSQKITKGAQADRRRQSEKMKSAWADGSKRQNMITPLVGRPRSAETSEAIARSITAVWADPSRSAPIRNGQRTAWDDPAMRARMTPNHIGLRRTEETCARIGAAKRGSRHTAETKAKMAEAQRIAWRARKALKHTP